VLKSWQNRAVIMKNRKRLGLGSIFQVYIDLTKRVIFYTILVASILLYSIMEIN